MIGDPSKAPLISQDNDYKREIAAKFGIKSLGDHAFRSIAGTTTGFIRLDTQFDNKYVHLNPIEKSPAYLGDLEKVSISSRSNSFNDQIALPPPQPRKHTSNWFPSLFGSAPSEVEQRYSDVDVGIGGSFSDGNSYSRSNSYERPSSFDFD